MTMSMRMKKAQKVGEKLSLLLACEKYKRTGWSGRDSRSLGVRHSTVVNLFLSWLLGFQVSTNLYVSRFSLGRSVRSCCQTIPEKVRNSRSISMGFKGWGWLLWWSWVTFMPFRYKKFNERAQTANFSVLSRLRHELCAENTKNKENKRN